MTAAPFVREFKAQTIPESEIRQQFEKEIMNHANFKTLDLARREDGQYFYGYLQTMFVWYRKGYEAGTCRK